MIRRMRRLVLPLVASALFFVPLPAALVERVFAAGWYPQVQPLLTRASNAVAFAWLDPLVVFVVAAVLIGAARAWRRAAGWRRMANVLLPFLVLPLFAAMIRIDDRLLQAAASLGAPPRTIFWKVYFPLTLPALAAGTLLVFILCLGFYVTPAVLVAWAT